MILLEPTTAVANVRFTVLEGNTRIDAKDLTAGDIIDIRIEYPDGTSASSSHVLTEEEPSKEVLAPGPYVLGKGVTANAVALYAYGNVCNIEVI